MFKLSKVDVYNSAFSFWTTELKAHSEVTWDEFATHFVAYMKKNSKFEFEEDQLRNLRNLADPRGNMTLSMREYVIFYEKHWNNIHARRKILKEGIPFPTDLLQQAFSFEMKMTVEKAPKGGLINEGDTYKFPKFGLAALIQDDNFDKTFGKEGCDYKIIPNGSLDHQKELFRITPFLNGFHVKCNERNRRLKFKVEKRPYLLLPGMVIQIGLNSLFKVSLCNPLPREKHPEFFTLLSFEKDKFFEYLNEQTITTAEEYQAEFPKFVRKYADKQDEDNQFIRLECIKGPEKGQIFDLQEKLTFKPLSYPIGRIKTQNEIYLSDITISSTHCSICYYRNLGWTIEESSPTSFGTYILLPNYDQWKTGSPSFPHDIVDGMKLSVDDFVFKCQISKIDEKFENLKLKFQSSSPPPPEGKASKGL